MARARNIKPGFFMNDELAEMPALTRLLFAGLWCIADRSGRLEDKPKRIKAETLPYDECDVDDMLSALSSHHFIIRYEADNERYIQIVNFQKHQNPHKKEAPSIIPPPVECENCHDTVLNSTSTVQAQCKDEPKPEQAGLIPDSGFLIPYKLSSEVSDEAMMDGKDGKPNLDEKLEEQTQEKKVASRMTQLLISEITRNNPKFRPPGPQQAKWEHTMELMLTRDKRSPADMERIIRWCQADTFWKANVLSADSLRKHFDRFLIQSQNKPSGPGQGQVRQGAIPKRDNFEQRQYDDAFFDNISGATLKKPNSG